MNDLEDTLEQMQRQIDRLSRDLTDLRALEGAIIACRVYNSGAFSHNSSGNWLAVTFDSERWDVPGIHSTLSNTSRITFAVGGWYLVGGGVVFAANATGARGLSIRVGGATYIADHIELNLGAALTTPVSIATLYYFAAADYIELMAFQDSGGNLNINAVGNYTPEFWAIRLP